MTVRLRRHGGDCGRVSRESGDLGPQEAGRRDAPVVAGRLEASVRLLRQHGGPLTVTGLCEGERERRLDESRLRR